MLNFALSKMKQGEATKWLIIFADFCDSKNKARGSLGTRHLFKFLNGLLQVNCFSTAPHHRRFAAEQAAGVAVGRQLGEKSPPGGSLGTRLDIFSNFCVEQK